MTTKSEFKWVRSIFGSGENPAKQYHYIVDGGMNDIIIKWWSEQPDRKFDSATPSRLTTCPRVVWNQVHEIPKTNEMTWATKQRLLLGRLFENRFAEQLGDRLVYHWKDDDGVEVDKLEIGSSDTLLKGVPDYLLKLEYDGQEVIAVSDAKTSRSDSFGYLPIGFDIFNDPGWYKYRLQLTAYYLLLNRNPEYLKTNKLPTPTHLHLFSYSLDDGLVRREYIWQPTAEDVEEVKKYTIRFNRAMQSAKPPKCECTEFDTKFCPYAIEFNGKVGTKCCN